MLSGILFFIIVALPYVNMWWTRGSEPQEPATPAEELRILSPHRREVRQEYSRGFSDWMKQTYGRHATIRWLDAGGTSKMLKDVESRFATSPQAPGVDLLFGGGVAPYYQADAAGWLQTIDLPATVTRGIPATCAGMPVYDPNGRWFGVALSGFGIVYNQILLDRMNLPAPTAWQDLARPEYFSWIGSGDPRSSGSVHMCYEIILQSFGFEEGWSIITRLCANVRRFGESAGSVPHEVAAGEVAAGMVIDQYAQTVIEAIGADALKFVLPSDATILSADAIGLITHAPAPELATRFVEYALSEPGQRLLFQPRGTNGQRNALFRMPVLRALYDDPQAPAIRPYEYAGSFHYDDELGGRRWNLVNDLIGVWLIDSHAALTRAWSDVIRRGMPADDVRQLCAPPVPAEQLAALAQEWNDPRRRLEHVSAWGLAARERYRRLTHE